MLGNNTYYFLTLNFYYNFNNGESWELTFLKLAPIKK